MRFLSQLSVEGVGCTGDDGGGGASLRGRVADAVCERKVVLRSSCYLPRPLLKPTGRYIRGSRVRAHS